MTIGKWAVCRADLPLVTRFVRVQRETETHVIGDYGQKAWKQDVIRYCDTYPEAQALRECVAAIRAERDRRYAEIDEWVKEEMKCL